MSPLVRRDPVDHQYSPAMMQAPASEDTKQQAIAVIKELYRQGLLPPVDGFPLAQTVDVYLDILGLNGREPASNARAMRT